MSTRFANLTVMVAVLALSGCEAMNAALFPPKAQPTPASSDQPSAPQAQTANVAPDLRPGQKPRTPQRRIDAKSSLIGKSQGDVRTLLGLPSTTENASPATIWRYTTQTCSLEVLFYIDLGTNTLRALDYNAKVADAAANDDATSQCLSAIQSTNRVSTR